MEGVLWVEGKMRLIVWCVLRVSPSDDVGFRDSSLVSSSCLSFKRRLLERADRRWKGNGGVKRSFNWRTREQETNVRLEEISLLPTSMTTLSRVRP